MLTAEQRAEGRRLLAACNNVPDYEDFNDRYYDATDWLYKHAEALLSEPPAIDVEAIKRAAVREFAEEVLSYSDEMRTSEGVLAIIRRCANARCVTLESERAT